MFFFPLPLSQSNTLLSLSLSVACKLSTSISPTSNPPLINKSLSRSPPPLRMWGHEVPSPRSAAAADPHLFQPFLLMHYGYLKLVQHDIISFSELPEKSKLQNQSCRRSSWVFITSIACLHEYLSFLTDPICHNGCQSREKRRKKRSERKKIHSLKLMYNSCQCFLAWKGDKREVKKKHAFCNSAHIFHLIQDIVVCDQSKPRALYSLVISIISKHIKSCEQQTANGFFSLTFISLHGACRPNAVLC